MNETADTGGQFARAASLHQSGDLATAERMYRDILRVQPDHGPANHYLGLLLKAAGRPEEALGLMRRSLEISPQESAFHNNYGNLLRGCGDLKAPARRWKRRCGWIRPMRTRSTILRSR